MSKNGPASVEFRNVVKRYGTVKAVDNINFTIEPGKLVTLLQRFDYKRALCAHMPPIDGVDQVAELRKMRLLLESLL